MAQRRDIDPPPADLRAALLHSLGLDADASPQDVHDAHRRIGDYLQDAPEPLTGWARQQATAADAAHAVLTGEAGDVLARTTAPAAATGRAAGASSSGKASPLRLLTSPLVLLALVAAIVVGVYKLGPQGPSKPAVAMSDQSTSAPTGMPTQTATPVDPARAKALQDKVAKNPADLTSMAQLGDMYFAAESYQQAATWRDKILAVRPNDTDALLASGVAWFNLGNLDTARARWTKATQVDPKKAEAYYDLGFLELSKTPPDTARAKALWDKVVELDGNGPLAQKVRNHMGALATPAPAPATTTPSASPSSATR